MYNGGNTDGYGGGIQSHGGSRYSPYGNNATPNHLQAKDMVSPFPEHPSNPERLLNPERPDYPLTRPFESGFKGLKVW